MKSLFVAGKGFLEPSQALAVVFDRLRKGCAVINVSVGVCVEELVEELVEEYTVSKCMGRKWLITCLFSASLSSNTAWLYSNF